MKIVLTIDYSIDGEIPISIDIGKAITASLPSVIVSESVDGTDDWAILIESVNWEDTKKE